MVIFIDESGSFSNPQGKENVLSCVGALSVPESCIDPLFIKFQELKKYWNAEDEIKGSQLSEEQADQLVNLCLNFDVTLKVVATDLGLMNSDTIGTHKKNQAEKLRVSSQGTHPNMVNELHDLANRISKLPDQLYTQSFFMTLLLDLVIRETSLYYCQHDAQCLGNFTWMIDAKDKNITEYEQLWSTVCMPFLEGISVGNPLIQIREGDYSAFAKYLGEKIRPPEHMLQHLKPDQANQPFLFLDIKKLLSVMTFSDSKKELGLQLVDLLTTIVRRSFSRTLQIKGWKNIGKLMLQVEKTKSVVHFAVFGPPGKGKKTTPYGKIVTHFNQTARPVFK